MGELSHGQKGASRSCIDQEELRRQFNLLIKGVRSPELAAACVAGDGVVQLSRDEAWQYNNTFVKAVEHGLGVTRFVPASGAATRMFAAFANPGEHAELTQTILSRFSELALATPFLEAFGEAWERASSPQEQLKLLNEKLLGSNGLNYSEMPKGAIPFHRYSDVTRTAFEEHLHEAVQLVGAQAECEVHFTVPPIFNEAQRAQLSRQAINVGEAYKARLRCSFSEQEPATDTVALDENGELFRRADGSLLLRPGGHGALLHNLNRIQADVIFIKNIDNVLPDRLKSIDLESKAVLGGLLLELKSERDRLLQALMSKEEAALSETASFAERWFLRQGDALPGGWDYAMSFLDRPIRVCGMVRNEGQPGGGPFWLADSKFGTSAQIVERAQLTLEKPDERAIFENSTHFNPVDVVCATQNPAGRSYDLTRFVNPQRVFIADKTHEGRPLRALEHPGLWNGAMEDWLTVFVEVDPRTFAPVKTVVDLLNPEHIA